ncbi:hypothetical protein, partial [Streptomyces alkaliphilus]|uniref:hypothetical protein n=1 Tax=Streptomyces alkaliphilus TaxID=1472722 RepID=UPI001E36ABFF
MEYEPDEWEVEEYDPEEYVAGEPDEELPAEPVVGYVPYAEVEAETPPGAYEDPGGGEADHEEVVPLTPWYPPVGVAGDAGEMCDTGVAWDARDGAGA